MSNGPYIVDETCLVFAKNIEEENERLRAENEKLREAIAAERERCAKIAEDAGATMDEYICVLCGEIAAAIRESGDE